jgi:flagellar basal-body rod protein FlgB
MDLADIPLFSMLRGRLGYLSERQKIIAENVANSDTPGYRPHDLKPFSFEAQMKAQTSSAGVQAMTQPGHMQAPNARRSLSGAKPIRAADSEMTLDGNGVVLEEEMMKMTDARMSYDAAIGFYQRSLGMLRTAIRAPGRG